MNKQELIGVILGYIIVIGLMIGVGYSAGAFIEWEANPGEWFILTRILSVVVTSVLILSYYMSQAEASSRD